jgi:hypothetical protein
MNFAAKATPMTRQGLATALERLQLGAGESAALWSVFEVETSGVTQGFGFRADRRPQILFERHIFRKQTEGRFNASAPDLSGSPGGYGLLSAQYDRLERAIALATQAGLGAEPALRSASWGLGQVMGFNFAAAGYPSAAAMVQAMVQGEDAQLLASVGFMVANRLDRALRARDWAGFARVYNGPAFAQNQYDIKLQQAYARFSSGSGPNLEVRAAQAALLALGFAPGKIDGVLGERTRGGLRAFQMGHGLPVSGELSSETYAALYAAAFG